MTLDYKIRGFEIEDSEQVIKLLDKSGLYHKPWDNERNYMEKKKISKFLEKARLVL